jgi:hypothetical protein
MNWLFWASNPGGAIRGTKRRYPRRLCVFRGSGSPILLIQSCILRSTSKMNRQDAKNAKKRKRLTTDNTDGTDKKKEMKEFYSSFLSVFIRVIRG